jgi:hypothetical protein
MFAVVASVLLLLALLHVMYGATSGVGEIAWIAAVGVGVALAGLAGTFLMR